MDNLYKSDPPQAPPSTLWSTPVPRWTQEYSLPASLGMLLVLEPAPLMHYLVSTCILIIIGVGLYYRHDVKRHVTAMVAAFVLDVGLVLAIELQKQAINTFVETVQNPEGEGLLLFHIGVSLTTIALYTVLTILGVKILKGKRELLTLHRNLAAVFLLCRLTNYVTSFMVGSP